MHTKCVGWYLTFSGSIIVVCVFCTIQSVCVYAVDADWEIAANGRQPPDPNWVVID